jgi:hypothetical protein
LINQHGYKKVSFAEPLKAMLTTYFRTLGLDEAVIHDFIEGARKEMPTEYLQGKTARWAMQSLGTEWGRNLIGDQIWTDAFKIRSEQYPRVVCTDMRFDNEVTVLRSLKAITVRVVSAKQEINAFSDHPSETAIDTLPVDIQIVNEMNGVEALQNKMVRAVMLYEQLGKVTWETL